MNQSKFSKPKNDKHLYLVRISSSCRLWKGDQHIPLQHPLACLGFSILAPSTLNLRTTFEGRLFPRCSIHTLNLRTPSKFEIDFYKSSIKRLGA